MRALATSGAAGDGRSRLGFVELEQELMLGRFESAMTLTAPARSRPTTGHWRRAPVQSVCREPRARIANSVRIFTIVEFAASTCRTCRCKREETAKRPNIPAMRSRIFLVGERGARAKVSARS